MHYKNYNDAVVDIWRHSNNAALDTSQQKEQSNMPISLKDKLYEIVRYGTLAPSSHNTQCWKFRISEQDSSIHVLPDFSRSCPIVDPDNHHLFVSLGCAVENMVLAGRALGLDSEVDASNPKANGIRIQFSPGKVDREDPFFLAIPERQSSRSEYNGEPLPKEDLELLKQAGTGNGVRVELFTDAESIGIIRDYVLQGNSVQIANKAFVTELKEWIRFDGGDILKHKDGIYSASTGNPSLPRWLANFVFPLVFQAGPENQKCVKHIASSAGVAIFVSEQDDAVHWVEAGRCYERFALESTVLQVRNAMLNQPVEEASLRPAFLKALELSGARPDLVVRFGKGPTMPRSLRRSVDDVIIVEE
ncbi:Putative NAD(P)H nitroreductase [Seminavis robusta]|uniref:NAD(P)H nitroreductase n=1 Tax=Seminavis robusta TaxID=568900 RepID=A0A9N8HHX6_9STRA|nr:Putative NAD(P)H nitroreductase [Seminavis robusta]|eukprot:Sro589_g171700.1 Putative NAD(P)H nitroreductase (361) ;mRNA; f:18538-19620